VVSCRLTLCNSPYLLSLFPSPNIYGIMSSDSGGVHRTPTSGLWSKFNFIRVQSGGLQWTPPDTLLWTMVKFNYIRVQSTGLHRTPPDPPSLDYSQILIPREFSPADSGGHTGPPSLDHTQLLLIFYSSGLRQTPADPPCDDM
jgi:hypothetical protein